MRQFTDNFIYEKSPTLPLLLTVQVRLIVVRPPGLEPGPKASEALMVSVPPRAHIKALRLSFNYCTTLSAFLSNFLKRE